MRQLVLLVVALVQVLQAEFTPHFRKFIHDSFGVSIASTLERTDLGLDASFGGQLNDNDKPRKQAVILVHGITNKITRFLPMVQFLRSQGYTNSEVYGTTYGDAGATPIGLVDMKCSYVKQIRKFHYCRASVHRYSSGHRGLLNGCTHSKESDSGWKLYGHPRDSRSNNLKIPDACVKLTFQVLHSLNLSTPSSLLQERIMAVCFVLCLFQSAPVTGEPVYTVTPTFLQDINNQAGYEGTYVFSIFSTADEKVPGSTFLSNADSRTFKTLSKS
ncbi:triacylglycerol lipase [Ostertagia ostertagi]